MTCVNRTYQYSPPLRVLALFGSMLAGGILLGSVLAEIEAADVPDLIVHGIGVIVSLIILGLGLEFGMRRITPSPGGLSTRLIHERTIAWHDVRDGPFGALIVVPRRGLPIAIWPFLEDFDTLRVAVDALRRGQVDVKGDTVSTR